ncbi:conserved Plasmodium protein, unknown function [Plasmodium sp. gorilla clade G1]|nr:conserved Plasmodium protein, unknown function [Plasmodium sp. gorilla clade G1]
MGNIIPFKTFEEKDTKTKDLITDQKYLNIDNPKDVVSTMKQHNSIKNNSSMEQNENNIKHELEKIKNENFYLFDDSLDSNNMKHPCHAQWFLFWVFASYLNEKFSDTEKENVHAFYSNFPEQCIRGKGKNCFSDFLKIYPIRAGTREELMMWLQMCENYCRKKADLPVKVFNYGKLLKRWRYDDDYI